MDFIKPITELCQPFLGSWYGCNKFLLRGISPSRAIKNGMWQEDKTPDNRQPKNMTPPFHNAADNWFLEHFGVRYRSNVVICTGDWNIAQGYGDVHAIFPIGTFSVCWSNVVCDLYEQMSVYYPGNSDSEKAIHTFLNTLGYQQGNLKSAINSGNELLIHSSSFIRVRLMNQHEEQEIVNLLSKRF